MDFRILDHNSPHFGVPLQRLMENAARALAKEVARLRPRRILVVCGLGNNGGDGLAMVPLLPPDVECRIVLAGDPSELQTPEARWAAQRLDPARHPLEPYRSPERFRELAGRAELIVDALLGSGATGALREPIRTLVRLVNAARRPVLSVDVPTGLGGRPAVHPTVTLALHARKHGMTRANSGRIVVRDIGIPRAALEEVGPADFSVPYPRSSATSHKGQNGRVLVVAGGPYTGAPLLCAQAALRCGVDLVHLYAPGDAAHAAQGRQADLIVHPGTEPRRLVPEDAESISALLRRVDAVLVGPGLGTDPGTRQTVLAVLRAAARRRTPAILDADALDVAGRDPALTRRLRPLATPHAGEYRDFTRTPLPVDPRKAMAAAARQARRLRSTLLVKGPTDIVTDGVRTKVNRLFHHPAMTAGGTGDVLAGICTALVAKGMEPFRAACAAAFVNGYAGRAVAECQGGTLIASDLIGEIPQVFGRWLGPP